ncbi:ATP-binding protein [Luteimonas deserti]|uniref:ATP-binding protein n=1 Tax=Luteimonas deserti TaxID=2752306 RepID=A0A7Z0QPD7_9GAMM|nr:ATP-binding protein [Luteimonas deserti]NYZ61531.1 ATP-binding protein [Luteimonas deserti]
MPRARALLAWSGGKDAAWALQTLRARADVEVVGLMTTVTAGRDEAAMQGVHVDVLRAQARATGLPLIESRIAAGAGNPAYEAAFAQALATARARWPELTMIAFGDLFLADIRAWREALCARLGWQACFPLFGRHTTGLAREMQAAGLRASLCCVDTTQLDADFSGRDFDAALLEALPAHVDPCGERGEFHTCVHAGPMFAEPLALLRGDTALRDSRFACTAFSAGG